MAVDSGKTPPFLWRCEDTDHYWRRKDDTAPTDGKIVCRTCGGALEFHQTDKGRYWRCIDNNRHRITVHRDHLRLPAMRELLPRRELAALEREWKLKPSAPRDRRPLQMALVDIEGGEAAPLATSEVASLAPRELEVLRLMASGRSSSDIARDMGLRPDTVKSYAKSIRRKLGVTSRKEAIESARASGLVR